MLRPRVCGTSVCEDSVGEDTDRPRDMPASGGWSRPEEDGGCDELVRGTETAVLGGGICTDINAGDGVRDLDLE